VLGDRNIYCGAHRLAKDENPRGMDPSNVHSPIHKSKSIEYNAIFRRCASTAPKALIIRGQDMSFARLTGRQRVAIVHSNLGPYSTPTPCI